MAKERWTLAADVPVVSCTADEDRARQEYRLQSDLAYQVQRFGVGMHPAYGVQDFDAMDLTRAFEIVDASRVAWMELPAVIRERYGSWGAVEKAAQTGELEQVLKAAGLDGGSSPSEPVASPSDSAAASAGDSPS